MAFPKAYVDAMLVNWGDRLFRAPLRHVAAPRLPSGHVLADPLAVRERLARTLRRAPEVMVRITNCGSKAHGMRAIGQHFRYISRNGRVELEDQDGRTIAGLAALRDLMDEWRWGGWGIPEHSARREVIDIVLSMPPGTDRQRVREAARAFAAEEFGRDRWYVFAAHDDEPHPHVHLSVQVRGPDGRSLGVGRCDLRRWRERFAAQLRERGVDANATPRWVRGEIQRAPTPGLAQMIARGETPRVWRATPDGSAQQAMSAARGATLIAWKEIARALAASEASEDRRTAMDVVDFVQTMTVRQYGPEPSVQRLLPVPRARRARPERTLSLYAPVADHPGAPEIDIER